MKLRIISVAVLVATLIVAIPMVQAFDWSDPYNSLTSGYRVTTDKHGEEVLIGEPVTAWAGTTNMDIEEVKFRWLKPDGSEFVVVAVSWGDPGTSMGEWNGQDVREFSNTQIPGEVGDWGVQGIFYDGEGHGRGPIPDQPEKTAIRARSFHAVPEVTIGTIGVVLAMFGALGLFAIKKKRISIRTRL